MRSSDPVQRRADLVAGLRELADLYERNVKLPLPAHGVSIQLDVTVKEDSPTPWSAAPDEAATKKAMKSAIRAMGRGKKEKVYSDYSFVVNRRITPEVLLQVQTSRAAVCRKVPTGRVIVRPAETYTTPRTETEEFEWVCDDPVFAEPKQTEEVAD